jgi:hypothetical protein
VSEQNDPGLQFYLGAPEPSWLWRVIHAHLFISHNRLSRLKRLRRATTGWALDSGGFWEVTHRGGWELAARDYLAAVARYDREIGGMEWAAPQDWMVEDAALAATGLTEAEHQARTVASVVELRAMWSEFSDDSCPIMPVVQGRTADSYLRCVELYRAAGLDLAGEPLVGIGSVCRLERTPAIVDVVTAVAAALPGVALHGFGVKLAGLRQIGHLLASADSQAWSMWARRDPNKRTNCCTHKGACAWCGHFALLWRRDVLAAAGKSQDFARFPEHGGGFYGVRAAWLLGADRQLAVAA